ncbi:hypothetical protein [Leisingera sp. M658]|uniref:hypothetical protein n=1 Tax=Leisingera sp. M658 TaxID=2867015 RepID=UPI0021A63068|nr:hypothetical protein [Leisingera sp. M658]UWQ77060.1 hypothetical protein K3724_15670 [Leisingera sp. M658]
MILQSVRGTETAFAFECPLCICISEPDQQAAPAARAVSIKDNAPMSKKLLIIGAGEFADIAYEYFTVDSD